MLHAMQLRSDNIDAVVVIAAILGIDFRHVPHELPYYTETQFLVIQGDLSDYTSLVLVLYGETEFNQIFKFTAAEKLHALTRIVLR